MRRPQILLDQIHFKSTEAGPSVRGGPLPTQSYTIHFSDVDTGMAFELPSNTRVPFVGATPSHMYTYGDVYDFFSFVKTQMTDSLLTTPVYKIGDSFYRLSLEKFGEVSQIVQKRVDESGNVLKIDGREVVRVLNIHHGDVNRAVCARYVNVDIGDIPREHYTQILQVTGQPWRFCDYWGQPWKIVRSDTGDYRWVARPGTQGHI